LAQGCVWAEVLSQGETLALMPNMMDNRMVIHQIDARAECWERREEMESKQL